MPETLTIMEQLMYESYIEREHTHQEAMLEINESFSEVLDTMELI